jgi:hypothetical protein
MIKLSEINKNIVFEPKGHTYHDCNGKEYISVSKLISLYKPEFDEFGHIARACAKRDKVSVEDIKGKWKQTNKEAIDRGHNVHSQLEHYIKTGTILDADYKDVVEQFSKIKFTGKLFSEIGLNHPEYFISGTADLIEVFDDNTCELYDFKSNKEIKLKSKYHNKLYYPLENYEECEIHVYSIQLGIYKNMLEYHGYKVKNITLFWINPKSRLIETFKIPNIDNDINKLLKHYDSLQNF